MKNDLERHHRRSIRLKGYDYSKPGAYFVTICTHKRLSLFGRIVDGRMEMNSCGELILKAWKELPEKYSGVNIDSFVVMPDHLHGIIVLGEIEIGMEGFEFGLGGLKGGGQARGPARTGPAPAPGGKMGLPDVVRSFKSWTTKVYSEGVKEKRWEPFPGRLWHRNYWERIIRNRKELDNIRKYIANNPMNWEKDIFNKSQKEFV